MLGATAYSKEPGSILRQPIVEKMYEIFDVKDNSGTRIKRTERGLIHKDAADEWRANKNLGQEFPALSCLRGPLAQVKDIVARVVATARKTELEVS